MVVFKLYLKYIHNTMATSSTRGNRDFDFAKPQKRSFEFTKDNEEPPLPPSPKLAKAGIRLYKILSEPKFWIFLGVIVVCVIGYFIFSKSGDTPVAESAQEKTEIVEETIAPTDSVANQEKATEEFIPADENEVSNIADDQEAKVNETPATIDNNSNIATTTTSTASNTIVSNNVEAEAMKVIRGDYGDGQERKDKLGANYQTIQSRVNELKRKGIF